MTDETDRQNAPDAGYIVASERRYIVMSALADSPSTPSRIVGETDYPAPNVSQTIKQLRERGLVELLVSEDTQKGRVYGITEQGRDAYEFAHRIKNPDG